MLLNSVSSCDIVTLFEESASIISGSRKLLPPDVAVILITPSCSVQLSGVIPLAENSYNFPHFLQFSSLPYISLGFTTGTHTNWFLVVLAVSLLLSFTSSFLSSPFVFSYITNPSDTLFSVATLDAVYPFGTGTTTLSALSTAFTLLPSQPSGISGPSGLGGVLSPIPFNILSIIVPTSFICSCSFITA